MKVVADPCYRWLFWSLALIGLTVDQGTKYGVFYHLYTDGPGHKAEAIIPGAFELLAQYTGERDTGETAFSGLRTCGGDVLPRVNPGALFGLLAQSGWDANMLFAFVSVAAALAIIYWSFRPHTARDRFLSVALGLILAGTLGNLYDRVVFGGVRDFLHWYYLVDWPVFNMADCCLVCGAGLLLVQAFFTETHPASADSPVMREAEVAEAK